MRYRARCADGANGHECITTALLLNNSSPSLDHLTLRHGNGQGLYLMNNSTPVLDSATIESNASNGVIVYGSRPHISNSSIDRNGASGLAIDGASTVLVDNSTIAGNTGALGGGVGNSGTLTLASSTVSGNSAQDGGGVYNAGTLTLEDSVLAGNSAASGAADCSGTLVSKGYNILGNTTSCAGLSDGQKGDQVGTGTHAVDPRLDTLRDNGGPTWTMAPLPGSPAIGGGDPHGCVDALGQVLARDQRGLPRPGAPGARCDSGTVEYQGVPPTPTPTATSTPTATNTPTNTPTPTATPTDTPTDTPAPTATTAPIASTGVGQQYDITTSQGVTVTPGITDTGNHCDDCSTQITLPFSATLYGQQFGTAYLTSNGQLDFTAPDESSANAELPDPNATDAIFAHWGDLRTDTTQPDGSQSGIFTAITGTVGSRTFAIEWRATYYDTGDPVDFEVILYENSPRFDVIYGNVDEGGSSATVGVQQGTGDSYTQYESNTGATLRSGLDLCFTPDTSTSNPSSMTSQGDVSHSRPYQTDAPTDTPTPTLTDTPTDTPTPTLTDTPTAVTTLVPTLATNTSTSSASTPSPSDIPGGVAGMAMDMATPSVQEASAQPGVDLPNLDMPNAHYTSDATGLTHVRLYEAPVGLIDTQGWHMDNTQLNGPSYGMLTGDVAVRGQTVSATHLPFAVHIASSGSGPVSASLTNEDGVSLGIGIFPDGRAPVQIPAHIRGNAVVFDVGDQPEPTAGPSLLAIATASDTATATGTATATSTATSTSTDTPTNVSTMIPTPTPIPTPSILPTVSITAPVTVVASTVTVTNTLTPTNTGTSVPITTSNLTLAVSVTGTAVVMATEIVTNTPTDMSSLTPTDTSSPTPTNTFSHTPTATFSPTPTATVFSTDVTTTTGTLGLTSIVPPTASSTATAMAEPTASPTPTMTSIDTPTSQPTSMSSAASLMLHATTSGLEARLTVHSVSEQGPFVFALSLEPGTSLVQDPNGTIKITRPITESDDNGNPIVVTQTEYFVENPYVGDQADPLQALIQTQPANMTLLPQDNGMQRIAVSIDPQWLHDARRVFPVSLTVPIVTAYSALYTGLSTTESSCTPDRAMPQIGLVVGVEGPCTYRSNMYFNVGQLPADKQIVAATLHLYTPDHVEGTPVQLYPNAAPSPGWQPKPWNQPTWNDAPSVVAGVDGIVQSENNSHWRGWDVTGLIRRWVDDSTTNGGFTLTSDAAAVLFGQGTGSGGAAITPYIDVTYRDVHGADAATAHTEVSAADAPAAPILYNPGAQSIYGLSGGGDNPAFLLQCNALVCANGELGVNRVRDLKASFMRITVSFSCNPTAAEHGRFDATYKLMRAAYDAGIIPIVTLQNNPSGGGKCLVYDWDGGDKNAKAGPVYDFIHNMHSDVPGTRVHLLRMPDGKPLQFRFPLPMTYFEIGNEVNIAKPRYVNYEHQFATAARALFLNLGSQGSYRVVTAGFSGPTATQTDFCTNNEGGTNTNATGNTFLIASKAIKGARDAGVPVAHLGLAVHPYGYWTPPGYYWQNYHSTYGQNFNIAGQQHPYGECLDLQQMLMTWSGRNNPQYLPHDTIGKLPIVFTEINWKAGGGQSYDTNCDNRSPIPPTRFYAHFYTKDATHPHNGVYPAPRDGVTGCEGSYLADLFTWMHGHNYTQDPQHSPVVVAVFAGGDGTENDTPVNRDPKAASPTNPAPCFKDNAGHCFSYKVHSGLGLYYIDGGQYMDPRTGAILLCAHNPLNRTDTGCNYQDTNQADYEQKVFYIDKKYCRNRDIANPYRRYPTTTIDTVFVKLRNSGCDQPKSTP